MTERHYKRATTTTAVPVGPSTSTARSRERDKATTTTTTPSVVLVNSTPNHCGGGADATVVGNHPSNAVNASVEDSLYQTPPSTSASPPLPGSRHQMQHSPQSPGLVTGFKPRLKQLS